MNRAEEGRGLRAGQVLLGGAARVDQGEDEPAEGAERGEDGAFHPALLDPEAMGAERANAPAK